MLHLGLRAKFFLYSNTLIVVTMGLVGVVTVMHERETRYAEIVSRATAVAQAMAIPITDALMYEELDLVSESGLIDNFITEMLDKNKDVLRYVVVADANGVVTHSNRWDLMGQRFRRHIGREAIGMPLEVEMRTSSWGERIVEVRAPLAISTRFWGSLTVGFSLAPIDSEVRMIAQRTTLIAVLLMLGNSILTAIYVETLIRPILNLYQTIKRAGKGDMAARAVVRRGDEVGELADAFNRMMDELEEAKEREARRQAQLAHTEKMVAVGTLAAGVAHEVNNPLAGILTCIETLRANPGDGALHERYLDLVQDGIKRIEHTVLNLLDFSRPRPLQAEPTSLNHNLHHVAELVEYQVRKNRVEVRFDLDRVEPVVLADHFQMEQLMLNLVLNAIQAMPDGGTLTLRSRTSAHRVYVDIEDTGQGIPDEVRDRIFDPFFTTRDVGQGTGLGLSVSYSIVKAHGGAIEVVSEVGKGTRFRITFPIRPALLEEVQS